MLKPRYPANCTVCGSALPAGVWAQWDSTTRTVTCAPCARTGHAAATPPSPSALDRGQPGASAQREYWRRRRNREAGVRSKHPHIGGLLLAMKRSPRPESAFLLGADGEESVAKSLTRRTAKGSAIILHDRRMPRGRGNIDHLAIAPTGVYVIDAKNISGKVHVSRPLFGAAKLLVNGRNRSKLVDGLDRQVMAVRQVLKEIGRTEVPVLGVFCFTAKADFPLIGRSEIHGHRLHHCRALARRLNRSGPLGPEAIDALARGLPSAFPSA
jgi:Nuclease-related domain